MIVNFDDIEIMHPDYGGGNVFFYQGKPFTGTIVEYHSNGNIVGEITVVNSHTHGRVALYFENGQIQDESFKKCNKLYGTSREWDESGNLVSEYDWGAEPQI